MSPRFFAVASKGTEAVLASELADLGIGEVEIRRGGVAFGRHLEDGYRACLWSRVASRVVLPLHVFRAETADALYDGVSAVDWTAHLGPKTTMAVDVAGKDAPAGPGHFIALKAKDAIVDRIREAEGARPNVDTADPDVRVNLHVEGAKVTVNLDLSGRGLHRRGIGRSGAEAPLKETLAAAILRLAGWHDRDPATPLLDPMCGSGTLLVEAAWMQLDVAPGLFRKRIGAEGWRGHDDRVWKRLQSEARDRRAAARDRKLRIAGSDVADAVVAVARENLERAGLTGRIRLERRELRHVTPVWKEPGVLVTNPPYGERLGSEGELAPFYELLGDVLKQRFPGWSAWVFTGSPALGKRIGLRPASRHVLFNGPIESRLLEIPIAAEPVRGREGPGWRRPSGEAGAFAKKLRKNLRERRAWADREGLTCYRLYDSDIPEFNVSVDWYDGAVRVEEYARPRKVPAADAERRLRDVLMVLPETLNVDPSRVSLRVRQRREAGEQHGKRDDRRHARTVREGDLKFEVNLSDYLDTGLFLDDRELRRRIRERARGRDFLNLFAYTCTASVAAAAGGARSTRSVDLSRTYLAWGRRNFELNSIALDQHRLLRADVVEWLERGGGGRRYDLVFVAPPTYSRSKAMRSDFDVQRDHGTLLARVGRILKPGGEALFTTNLRTFALDRDRLGGFDVREITDEVTPHDFAGRRRQRAWSVKRRGVVASDK